MKIIPTRLDRYPAKMVSHLADKLISKYTDNCTKLFDPFCGSGAILAAGRDKGIAVAGLDVNPYAVLLSKVKLRGFDSSGASDVCEALVGRARAFRRTLPIPWEDKEYWFTPATIHKYERLRYVAEKMNLNRTREGRAVLLSYALSVRLCSRADQRSPKPFISKTAIKRRKGKHFDPLITIPKLLKELSDLYGKRMKDCGKVACVNLASSRNVSNAVGTCSHIITSPPYINAQDYFRNFKLELHLLESLLPFDMHSINEHFIGTERGELMEHVSIRDAEYHKQLVPQLSDMEKTHPRQAAVVHRYLYDMGKSFDSLKSCLEANGVMVIVCGDNLVGGYAIATWQLINRLLETRGFVLFDSFGDDINNRHVPPKRNGHKGLIKQEVVSAFRMKSH
jgi:hypothetical protein